MGMDTIYARREPTTDKLAPEKMDVVLYGDKACTKFLARWVWHHNPPTKRNRYTNLNCARYRLEWVETA